MFSSRRHRALEIRASQQAAAICGRSRLCRQRKYTRRGLTAVRPAGRSHGAGQLCRATRPRQKCCSRLHRRPRIYTAWNPIPPRHRQCEPDPAGGGLLRQPRGKHRQPVTWNVRDAVSLPDSFGYTYAAAGAGTFQPNTEATAWKTTARPSRATHPVPGPDRSRDMPMAPRHPPHARKDRTVHVFCLTAVGDGVSRQGSDS